MVHYKVCPLCGSDNIVSTISCTDHLVSKRLFNLITCKECNFIFTQDPPDENEIGQFYESEDYISHSDSSKGISNKLYRLVRRVMLKRKRNLVKKITGRVTGSLLDIGSGTGYFAAEMKNSGWEVYGIEINERAREYSKKYFNIEIFPPSEIETLKNNTFDCITLWHVLEHFHNPFAYTEEIKRLLKPGGKCIIALPNCSSYDASCYKSFWAGYDVPRHLWHFSPESFRFFCNKTGLRLITERTLPIDVFYISQLSERYRDSSFPLITGTLKASVFALRAFFNKKRTSSMIYLVETATTAEH